MEAEETECKLVKLTNEKPPIFHGKAPTPKKSKEHSGFECFTNTLHTTQKLHKYGKDYYFIGALSSKYVSCDIFTTIDTNTHKPTKWRKRV